MQSAFLPELHRWISKLIARHLHACPPGDLLITMVKETVILYKKRVSKNEKKVVSLLDLKEMKARNDCEIACDCVKRANVVLHVRLCKEIFARKHTATHKPTSAQPPHSDLDDTHTHIQSVRRVQKSRLNVANDVLRALTFCTQVQARRKPASNQSSFLLFFSGTKASLIKNF